MSPIFQDHSVGFNARKSLAQHLLPSWRAALALNAKDAFLEKAVCFWLLVFPEDILPEQEDEFYARSCRLDVFQISVYQPDFLTECWKRFTKKNLPDTPDRYTKRDDIVQRTMVSLQTLSTLEEERARMRLDPKIPRSLFVELLQEVNTFGHFIAEVSLLIWRCRRSPIA